MYKTPHLTGAQSASPAPIFISGSDQTVIAHVRGVCFVAVFSHAHQTG